MKDTLPALCWAGAILGVGAAGAVADIDAATMATLLIGLPALAWTSLSAPACRLALRRV